MKRKMQKKIFLHKTQKMRNKLLIIKRYIKVEEKLGVKVSSKEAPNSVKNDKRITNQISTKSLKTKLAKLYPELKHFFRFNQRHILDVVGLTS